MVMLSSQRFKTVYPMGILKFSISSEIYVIANLIAANKISGISFNYIWMLLV